eukprot:g68370.t1
MLCYSLLSDAALATVAQAAPNLLWLCVAKCGRGLSDTGLQAIADGCWELRWLDISHLPALSTRGLSAFQTSRLQTACVSGASAKERRTMSECLPSAIVLEHNPHRVRVARSLLIYSNARQQAALLLSPQGMERMQRQLSDGGRRQSGLIILVLIRFFTGILDKVSRTVNQRFARDILYVAFLVRSVITSQSEALFVAPFDGYSFFFVFNAVYFSIDKKIVSTSDYAAGPPSECRFASHGHDLPRPSPSQPRPQALSHLVEETLPMTRMSHQLRIERRTGELQSERRQSDSESKQTGHLLPLQCNHGNPAGSVTQRLKNRMQ